MTFRRFYSEEQRGFRPLRVPPNVNFTKIHKVLFIGKTKDAAKSGVRSITGSALERSPICARSQTLRSSARNCSENPRRSELAMVARATCEMRVYMECARSWLMRSIARALHCWFLRLEHERARSCLWSLECTSRSQNFTFFPFSPF